MTEPLPIAKLAFITRPAPSEIVLNVQTEQEGLQQFKLTRDQLFNINADSANILVGESK